MDAITTAAGVSKRTLYKYYPSKEALVEDLVHKLTLGRPDSERERVRSDDLRIESRDDLERVLCGIASSIVANHQHSDYLSLVRLIIAEGPRIPSLIESFQNGSTRPGVRQLTAIFESARQSGVVTTDETDAAIRLFLGPIWLSSSENAFLSTGEPHWLTPAEIEAQVKLLVAAIT